VWEVTGNKSMYLTYYLHLDGIKEVIGERRCFETDKWE
jgi:hypothetical protein